MSTSASLGPEGAAAGAVTAAANPPEPPSDAAVVQGAARMRRAIETLPGQLAVGVTWAGDTGRALRGEIRRVVHCGMGGSAFPADQLRLLAGEELPLTICRDYRANVPQLGPGDLVVAASFSGNTEETLAAYADARQRGAAVIALCAGGRLAALAASDKTPCVRLQPPFEGFQPRAASGYFIGALARIIENVGLAAGLSEACCAAGDALAETFPPAPLPALAAAVAGRIPVFCAAGPRALGVARVAKIKFNENAKQPAFFAQVPELNHNELVGYTRMAGALAVVLIEDPDDGPRIRRRFEVMAEVLGEAGVPVVRLALEADRPPLARALALLARIDTLTVELAVAAGVDANAVALIERFKASL